MVVSVIAALPLVVRSALSYRGGMPNYRFTFVIERDEDGRFVTSCPALQGCCTEGETEAEVRASIAEVIQAHVELRLERGEPVGTEVGADTIDIAV